MNKWLRESNPNSKLNETQVAEIRAKYIPYKYSTYRLAEEYGVCQNAIMNILQNKRWIN